jgi:hypothetical protein
VVNVLPVLIPFLVPVLVFVGVGVGYVVVHGGRHGGVGFFQHRRVLRGGAAGTATIVARRDVRTFTNGRLVTYVTEYLLDIQQPGREALRASVTLPLLWLEQEQIGGLSSVPVRLGEGIVVIDSAAVKALSARAELAKKAEKDRAFDALRSPPR